MTRLSSIQLKLILSIVPLPRQCPISGAVGFFFLVLPYDYLIPCTGFHHAVGDRSVWNLSIDTDDSHGVETWCEVGQ